MGEGTVPKDGEIEVPVVPLMPGVGYIIVSVEPQPDGSSAVQLATHSINKETARSLLIQMLAKIDDGLRKTQVQQAPRVQIASASTPIPPLGKIV